jgi:hypothetical protein
MSVRIWGIRFGGERDTWRSTETRRGERLSGRLITELAARGSARSKASRSRSVANGNPLAGE